MFVWWSLGLLLDSWSVCESLYYQGWTLSRLDLVSLEDEGKEQIFVLRASNAVVAPGGLLRRTHLGLLVDLFCPLFFPESNEHMSNRHCNVLLDILPVLSTSVLLLLVK